MELSEMTAAQLREHAQLKGIDVSKARSKTALVKAIESASEPEQEKPKVALYTDHNLFHPRLGRLPRGYNVLDHEEADIWLKAVGERVRVATPQEVAAFYGA